MFCPNCGSFIETIGRTGLINFPRSCISCGHPLQSAQKEERKKGLKKYLYIGLMAFVVIFIGAIMLSPSVE